MFSQFHKMFKNKNVRKTNIVEFAPEMKIEGSITAEVKFFEVKLLTLLFWNFCFNQDGWLNGGGNKRKREKKNMLVIYIDLVEC